MDTQTENGDSIDFGFDSQMKMVYEIYKDAMLEGDHQVALEAMRLIVTIYDRKLHATKKD